jgi:4-diphosphocytidyl-2-C-methyl-D-erythritol kinase
VAERVFRAPAKINLTLEILARREDGYHALRSVMLPVGLADEIGIAPATQFSFACDPPELTAGNLVVRALEQIGLRGAPYALRLRKEIPVGGGLGGGSSDAATILRAAAAGTFGSLGGRDWLADARALGSDVPFFLTDTGALVEGTGERVTAFGALPPWWVVVLAPDAQVDTGDAYRRLAAHREQDPPRTRPRAGSASLRAAEAVQRADFPAAVAAAANDFEELVSAAYRPVAAALAALRAAGAVHAMLSGSGAATFSLCPDEATARGLAARLAPPAGARTFVAPLAATPAWRTPAGA